TALVVARIYREFLAGSGIYAIAEGLTRDRIPCPSAADPQRNPHRSVRAWAKSAVRVILTNPRYTGRQVWNKQRKTEILIDVEDVALGHETSAPGDLPGDLHGEQYVQPAQRHRLEVKESPRRAGRRPAPEEGAPAGVHLAGRRADPVGGEDAVS